MLKYSAVDSVSCLIFVNAVIVRKVVKYSSDALFPGERCGGTGQGIVIEDGGSNKKRKVARTENSREKTMICKHVDWEHELNNYDVFYFKIENNLI